MPSDHHSRDSSSSSTREGWLRDFSVLLRLRGVDGVRIGDELAKVETFCDDSGQEPKDAYGEPASYIATLHFASSRRGARWATAIVRRVLDLMSGLTRWASMVYAGMRSPHPAPRRAQREN
jgi:hypothetical protein